MGTLHDAFEKSDMRKDFIHQFLSDPLSLIGVADSNVMDESIAPGMIEVVAGAVLEDHGEITDRRVAVACDQSLELLVGHVDHEVVVLPQHDPIEQPAPDGPEGARPGLVPSSEDGSSSQAVRGGTGHRTPCESPARGAAHSLQGHVDPGVARGIRRRRMGESP